MLPLLLLLPLKGLLCLPLFAHCLCLPLVCCCQLLECLRLQKSPAQVECTRYGVRPEVFPVQHMRCCSPEMHTASVKQLLYAILWHGTLSYAPATAW